MCSSGRKNLGEFLQKADQIGKYAQEWSVHPNRIKMHETTDTRIYFIKKMASTYSNQLQSESRNWNKKKNTSNQKKNKVRNGNRSSIW